MAPPKEKRGASGRGGGPRRGRSKKNQGTDDDSSSAGAGAQPGSQTTSQSSAALQNIAPAPTGPPAGYQPPPPGQSGGYAGPYGQQPPQQYPPQFSGPPQWYGNPPYGQGYYPQGPGYGAPPPGQFGPAAPSNPYTSGDYPQYSSQDTGRSTSLAPHQGSGSGYRSHEYPPPPGFESSQDPSQRSSGYRGDQYSAPSALPAHMQSERRAASEAVGARTPTLEEQRMFSSQHPPSPAIRHNVIDPGLIRQSQERDFRPSQERDFRPSQERDFRPSQERDYPRPSQERDFVLPSRERDSMPRDSRRESEQRDTGTVRRPREPLHRSFEKSLSFNEPGSDDEQLPDAQIRSQQFEDQRLSLPPPSRASSVAGGGGRGQRGTDQSQRPGIPARGSSRSRGETRQGPQPPGSQQLHPALQPAQPRTPATQQSRSAAPRGDGGGGDGGSGRGRARDEPRNDPLQAEFPRFFYAPSRANLWKLKDEGPPMRLDFDPVTNEFNASYQGTSDNVDEHDTPGRAAGAMVTEGATTNIDSDVGVAAPVGEALDTVYFISIETRWALFLFFCNWFAGWIILAAEPNLFTRTLRFRALREYSLKVHKACKHDFLFKRLYNWVVDMGGQYPEFRTMNMELNASKDEMVEKLEPHLNKQTFQQVFHFIARYINYDATFGDRDGLAFYYLKTCFFTLVRLMIMLIQAEATLNGPKVRLGSVDARKDENLRKEIRATFDSLGFLEEFAEVDRDSFVETKPELVRERKTKGPDLELLQQNKVVISRPPPKRRIEHPDAGMWRTAPAHREAQARAAARTTPGASAGRSGGGSGGGSGAASRGGGGGSASASRGGGGGSASASRGGGGGSGPTPTRPPGGRGGGTGPPRGGSSSRGDSRSSRGGHSRSIADIPESELYD